MRPPAPDVLSELAGKLGRSLGRRARAVSGEVPAVTAAAGNLRPRRGAAEAARPRTTRELLAALGERASALQTPDAEPDADPELWRLVDELWRRGVAVGSLPATAQRPVVRTGRSVSYWLGQMAGGIEERGRPWRKGPEPGTAGGAAGASSNAAGARGASKAGAAGTSSKAEPGAGAGASGSAKPALRPEGGGGGAAAANASAGVDTKLAAARGVSAAEVPPTGEAPDAGALPTRDVDGAES